MTKDELYEVLVAHLPQDRPVVVLCVGTDRSTGDAYGPLVGTFLEQVGIPCVGTLADPCHAVNLEEKYEQLKRDYPDHFVLAVDASLGQFHKVGELYYHPEPLVPGAGVQKELIPVGDHSLTAVVNVSGYMGYFVLQNTRLGLVYELAQTTAQALHQWWLNHHLAQEVKSCAS